MSREPNDHREERERRERQNADRLALAFLGDGQGVEHILARLRAALAAFDGWAPPSGDAGMLLATLAAVRPAAIAEEIGAALADVIRRGDLSQTGQPTVDESFHLLALLLATPAHVVIPELVHAVLLVPRLHPRWYWKAVELLQALLDWRPDTVTLAALLATAERLEQREATALFHAVIAPLLLADPANSNVQLVQRICTLTSDGYDARYVVAALAEHHETTAEVRAWAREVNADWFPLHATWHQLFGERALRILCVHNIADGQGDEMIRTGPLLQALLDDHPETQVTLITDRAYLYGHPRIETISFDEPERIRATLLQPADALIEFFEPVILHLNHDVDLAYVIAAWRAQFNPRFDLQADKGWNQFTFATVRLGGFDWTEALQFNQMLDSSVYDPVFRLIAELGLPLRLGEQQPRSEPVLAGHHWPGADVAWSTATRGNFGQRPIALLNPFGGNAMLKGFVRQKFDDLAQIVRALVDEGYFVVLCPSGTAWGTRALISELLERLSAEQRRLVDIAPDPALPLAVTQEVDGTVQETALPSETMRRFISFIARADLVVTVEGWMVHAAYQLGKPYRLLLMPGSGDRSWRPWGRSGGQHWWLFEGDARLDRPPLPENPRKKAWLALLARVTDTTWQPLLHGIEQTDDQDIRRAAIHALGRIGDATVVPHLTALLDDRSYQTRSIAAEALLNYHRGALGHDGVPTAAILEAYRLMSGQPFPGWATLTRQGTTALPALYAALHGEEPIMRREAAIILEQMSRANGPASVDLVSTIATETRRKEHG